MATLTRASRTIARRFSTAAEVLDKNATKGPKLPSGNDPSAFHSKAHSAADSRRWKVISFAFGTPVVGFGILQAVGHHDHPIEDIPEYPYLKMATRSPRFPWGDHDLIGTPADRKARKEAAAAAAAAAE